MLGVWGGGGRDAGCRDVGVGGETWGCRDVGVGWGGGGGVMNRWGGVARSVVACLVS